MSFRRNWVSPTPSLASECAPTPEPKGVGHTRTRLRARSPNSDDWRNGSAHAYSVVETQRKKMQDFDKWALGPWILGWVEAGCDWAGEEAGRLLVRARHHLYTIE